MRVRFSHDIFRLEERGGVSRYFAELHRGLLERGHDSTIAALLHINRSLDGLPHVHGLRVPDVRPRLLRQAVTKFVDVGAASVPLHVSPPPDIFHHTYFSGRAGRGRAQVVTVYDMLHERFPEDFDRRDRSAALKQVACRQADLVLAISETTRTEVIERLGLSSDRVITTPLGVRKLAMTLEPTSLPEPFLLYVGSRKRRYKNFSRFLEAMARPAVDSGLSLVCFGGGPITTGEMGLIVDLGLRGRVEVRGGGDAQLAQAYARATALVYPSLYEGFGLPPLEAMVMGCPVLAAAGGAITETVGEAALLVDPVEVDSIAYGIAEIASDEVLRQRLVAAGHERADQFAWSHTVETTVVAYQSVL